MGTLYELTGEYRQLLEMLEEEELVNEAQTIKDTLDGIGGEIEVKADGYAKIIKELTAEAAKFEAEKNRLEERQNTLKNRAKALNDHLYGAMKLTGKTKFKTDLFGFAIQKNGGKQPMEFVPDVNIPDEYSRKEADNEKIRAALESGAVLPFAVLKERGEHLRIR